MSNKRHQAPNHPHGPPAKRQRMNNGRPPNGHPPNTNGHHGRQQQNNHNRRPQASTNKAPQQPQGRTFHRLLELQQINLLHHEVRKWMFDQCALSEKLEIEAKIGKLLTYKETNTITDNTNNGMYNDQQEEKGDLVRIHDKIGLTSLATIDLHKTGGFFESTVTQSEFMHLNRVFNAWYSNANSRPEARLDNLQRVAFPKLKYERARTVDKIYQINGDKSNSVRVSYDMKDTSKPKEIIEKKKKSSLNICYPRSKWDIRISASIENVVPKPINQIVSSLRCKDRIRYQYDIFSVDITSTYTYSEGLTHQFIMETMQKFKNKQDLPLSREYGTIRTYEVELEIVDQKYLQSVRKLAQQRQYQKLDEIVYFFTQAAIQLAELASNPQYTPAVCKTPQSKQRK